jgi:hypothetical protein
MLYKIYEKCLIIKHLVNFAIKKEEKIVTSLLFLWLLIFSPQLWAEGNPAVAGQKCLTYTISF